MTDDRLEQLKEIARRLRKYCLEMGLAAGGYGAHMGGSLSIIEIVVALYFEIMRYNNSSKLPSDHLILSKGHGILAQYAALVELGIVSEEELATFKQDGSRLTAHPAVNPQLGIDFATGSLGQGLSLGLGQALAIKRQGRDEKVFVILGDGECDEGSIWEAALMAPQFKLDNVVAIVDENKLQFDAPTSKVIDLGNLAEKWRAFGWDVSEVDGHDIRQIVDEINRVQTSPRMIVAHTVKGRGVSFMEDKAEWHNSRLTKTLYKQAMEELGD